MKTTQLLWSFQDGTYVAKWEPSYLPVRVRLYPGDRRVIPYHFYSFPDPFNGFCTILVRTDEYPLLWIWVRLMYWLNCKGSKIQYYIILWLSKIGLAQTKGIYYPHWREIYLVDNTLTWLKQLRYKVENSEIVWTQRLKLEKKPLMSFSQARHLVLYIRNLQEAYSVNNKEPPSVILEISRIRILFVKAGVCTYQEFDNGIYQQSN